MADELKLSGTQELNAACALEAGSAAHWERLFARMERRCLALAWRILNDSHLAADAVQEAFLRTYRARQSARPETVERWIIAAVANAARDVARSRRRGDEAMRQMRGVATEPAVPATPDTDVEARLRAALAQLDEQSRVTFLLVHQEGFRYEDVAREFGWPVGTVRSKLHRTRVHLREILRPRSAEL